MRSLCIRCLIKESSSHPLQFVLASAIRTYGPDGGSHNVMHVLNSPEL